MVTAYQFFNARKPGKVGPDWQQVRENLELKPSRSISMNWYGIIKCSQKEAQIPKTILGKTNLEVGRLGLGTWELGDQKTDPDDVTEIIQYMLDHGGNLIDTADCYSDAESILGKALKDINRDDYILVTKAGHVPENNKDFKHEKKEDIEFSKKVIKKNVEISLKKLKTDHIDVLLIHTSTLEKLHEGEVIDAVIEAQKDGKVRFIGYSGDNEEIIYASQIPEFSVVEMSMNITDMKNRGLPLKSVKEQNLGVLVKRPIANAFWRGSDIYKKAYEYAEDYRYRAKKMSLNNKDYLEAAIGFTMATPVDVLAIGTTRLDHMKENINIASSVPRWDRKFNSIISSFENAEKDENYTDKRDWLGLD
tara:strand:- start:2436 stop:3524 length:1089 start_codon:yes stop_codon:yes gene_type:complete